MSTLRGLVIHRAYSDTGALDIECPACQAPPRKYCTVVNALDGITRWRKVPCLARIPTPRVRLPDDDSPPAVDFSEPRHQ